MSLAADFFVPRIAPKPIGRGLSVRELPEPQFTDLRAICLHYEKKAGGKYASDSRAARYLFDLSRDLQAVLEHVEAQYASVSKRLRYLEDVVQEWDRCFAGASHPLVQLEAGEQLTPGTVLRQLERYHAANEHLRAELRSTQETAAAQSAAASRSAAEQLAAVQSAYEQKIERMAREHAAERDAQKQLHDSELRELSDKYVNACRAVYAAKEHEKREAVTKLQETVRAEVASRVALAAEQSQYYEQQQQRLERELQLREMQWQRKYELAQTQHRVEVERMVADSGRQLRELQDEHERERRASAAAPDRNLGELLLRLARAEPKPEPTGDNTVFMQERILELERQLVQAKALNEHLRREARVASRNLDEMVATSSAPAPSANAPVPAAAPRQPRPAT